MLKLKAAATPLDTSDPITKVICVVVSYGPNAMGLSSDKDLNSAESFLMSAAGVLHASLLRWAVDSLTALGG